ncbi:MAG: VOC family protein [Actinomycetota bacterium]|nr:VOC family protein [Actinomycetota bacterium]
MTVTGPDFVALQVADLDRAAAFYQNRLGLRPTGSGPPHAVVFDTTPIPFAVREPMPGFDPSSVQSWPGSGVVLWLAADDVEQIHRELAAAGIPIVVAPTRSPFGVMFTFRDPDGYAVTLHERVSSEPAR